MIRFFRALYMVYGIFIFSILLLVFIPIYIFAFALFGARATKTMIKISHYLFTPLFLGLILVRIKSHLPKELDSSQSYIIVSNHSSILDVLANAWATPFPYKFLSKIEVNKLPLFGYVARHLSILIDRKNSTSREAGLKQMKHELEAGYSIFIYPEGSRNRTEQQLAKFYDGAFKIAIETGHPILVETLVGANQLNSPHLGFGLAPGVIHCYLEEPINTSEMNLDSIPLLKKQVRNIMLSRL